MREMIQRCQFFVLVCIFTAGTAMKDRPGHSTTFNSCDNVRPVPDSIRNLDIFKLDLFYQKYTEAYGIPVLGSNNVPDEALRRACYIVRFMFADHSSLREAFYRLGGRTGIVARNEETLDIPEHSHLPEETNKRSRGLGAVLTIPISTGAEENLLCQEGDPYAGEDIFLHELAHGVHQLGLDFIIPGWKDRLEEAYANAKSEGLWEKTYAITNSAEYFAEGVQSFFNVNIENKFGPDGIHNQIGTKNKLEDYDPMLFNLIKEAFPCKNRFLKACETNRKQEQGQKLKRNCQPKGKSFTFSWDTEDCFDNHKECLHYALLYNRCEKKQHRDWMKKHCPATCNYCDPQCSDNNDNCFWWADVGECERNPGYMRVNCASSCGECVLQEK